MDAAPTPKQTSVKSMRPEARRLHEQFVQLIGSDAAEAFAGQLEKSARASETMAAQTADAFEQSRSFLPKGFDIETPNLADVYPIHSLIPPSARQFMVRHTGHLFLFPCHSFPHSTHSSYVLVHAPQATEAAEFVSDPPSKGVGKFVRAMLESRQSLAQEQAVEIYFLQQLLRFARLDDRGLNRQDVGKALSGVPEAIVDLLIRTFTTEIGRAHV